MTGAGGRGVGCNGTYTKQGTHMGKAVYRTTRGRGLIYWRGFWKMSNSDAKGGDFRGWFYSVKDSSGNAPPTGRWTTAPNVPGADPPPTLTVPQKESRKQKQMPIKGKSQGAQGSSIESSLRAQMKKQKAAFLEMQKQLDALAASKLTQSQPSPDDLAKLRKARKRKKARRKKLGTKKPAKKPQHSQPISLAPMTPDPTDIDGDPKFKAFVGNLTSTGFFIRRGDGEPMTGREYEMRLETAKSKWKVLQGTWLERKTDGER